MFLQKLKWLARPATPIFIYQIGKVGSTAIARALERLGLFDVYPVHRLNPSNILRVKREHKARGWPPPTEHTRCLTLYNKLRKSRQPINIISLVREPVGRNFSYYFQNLDKICGVVDAHRRLSTQQLIKQYPVEFPYSDDPLTWFDYEFKQVTGIDLYDRSVCLTNGYHEIRSDPYNVLILRSDAADQVKSEAIGLFLKIDPVPLARTHITEEKPEGLAYQAFRNTIRLTSPYLDYIFLSKYCRHFFDDLSLKKWRDEYAATGSIIPDSFLEISRF